MIMKLTEFKYKRPDADKICKELTELIKSFNESESFEKQRKIVHSISSLSNYYQSYSTLASINYSKDTTNKMFQEENDFFNLNNPRVQNIINEYYKALIKSPFRTQLTKVFGKQLFVIAELVATTGSDKIIDLQQKENQLASNYTKLLASAKINFNGEEVNLTGLVPYYSDSNRKIREQAQIAKGNFFQEHAEELDNIYDDLVKLRHEMALKLGFKNYVEMGYAIMMRSDYTPDMVADYRNQVLKNVVPLVSKLKKKQAENLGLNELKYYDIPFKFKNGNPKPKGNPDWIVEQATLMFEKLSPETDEFFTFMKDNELMDLENRTGKAGGGYCTFIPEIKSPFIFSNFNGTTHDIKVLTHEAGHAFQIFNSKDLAIPEYYWPTYEACEIHSMSMEFLTWPWMELFFKEDIEKFRYEHLSDAINFLPYGVAVDEFQHWVYENPEATPKDRKKYWKTLESKYLPHIKYENNYFMESGGFWQGQQHIYRSPFYYIDYTLAQVCAFQFWIKSRENSKQAWDDYLTLCKAGGSKSFLELVELAQLESPFKEGVLEKVVSKAEEYLNTIDDTNF